MEIQQQNDAKANMNKCVHETHEDDRCAILTAQSFTLLSCTSWERGEVSWRTHHTGGEQGPSVVGVVHADEGQAEDAEGQDKHLGACAHACAEEVELGGWPEHIPMDVLPACLLRLLSCIPSAMLSFCS